MTSVSELVTRVREALSVDVSYEDSIIPFGVERAAKRLLRDYHFPWSVKQKIFTGLAENQQSYSLPEGFKKELLVHFYDTEDETYTSPLLKQEGFVMPPADGVPRHYWLANGKFFTDIKLPADSYSTTHLVLWYESLSWEDNQDWMLDRFEDIMFTYAVFRLSAELNKPELSQIYAALWIDEQKSLAIYLNELEFDNGEYLRRAPAALIGERYPA